MSDFPSDCKASGPLNITLFSKYFAGRSRSHYPGQRGAVCVLLGDAGASPGARGPAGLPVLPASFPRPPRDPELPHSAASGRPCRCLLAGAGHAGSAPAPHRGARRGAPGHPGGRRSDAAARESRSGSGASRGPASATIARLLPGSQGWAGPCNSPNSVSVGV